ncbi:hypothetical protein BD626DRAFT_357988, partial [Schizophyllum amplum]
PSDYLRGRCPACFGSARRESACSPDAPDCLVQLDACFTQKHNLQKRDPVFLHPSNIVLAEETAERVDALREASRRPAVRKRRRTARESVKANDDEHDGLLLPAEVLRNCEDSFKAAQQSITKANTTRHDVTAAMALLCR